jgi:hypothetical protein
MKKNILLWTLYFVVCGVVIAAAINAGIKNGEHYEYRHFYTYTALANK